MSAPSHALYDPRNGDLSLQIASVQISEGLGSATRSNYFTIDWIRAGQGSCFADSACYDFKQSNLIFFSPYQQVRFDAHDRVEITRLQFHANFLCIETYHDEIGCNGILFNDLYGHPLVELDPNSEAEFQSLVDAIQQELADCGLAHAELLLSYLKVLLIRATRLKLDQQEIACSDNARRLPPPLDELRDLIESHYRELHSPADYARLLHVEPKSLGKAVKSHFRKTLTELIRERILKHAKWELLHTLKPVKQIAHELGYTDELYFSRLFKRATGYSPVFFREFETTIRGGKNLSMSSTPSSIPASASLVNDGSERV